ncbi:MAG TPA: YibE/F family protein [Syntrophomonadaceae bacterium]|nr:YibE/F family protein [Syntrophomonadaceae bacterium]
MRKSIFLVILSLILLFAITMPVFANPIDMHKQEERYEKARVLKVIDLTALELSGMEGYTIQEQLVTVKVLSGDKKGETLEITNTLSGSKGWDLEVKPNDKVILYEVIYEDSSSEIFLFDMARMPYLNYLILFFVLSIIVIGGIRGIKSLVALGLTILAIYKILLPALLKGSSPILITILILMLVTLMTMLIIAGFTKKSISATLGTIGGVIVAGILALLIGDLAHLTGFATEESRMLLHVDGLSIDMQGLLFAGIIIGALGATMDVAMSIASSIEEVKKANPSLSAQELMRAGMNVGRDIMGTMTNTLILAYTGGALPLLILYLAYDTTAIQIFNSELIATEIVRAIAGSIGLVFSVPITAFIASILANRQSHHELNAHYE